MRRTGLARSIGAIVALLVITPSASAQISEADRLARCQNNRDALVLLEFRQSQSWSDEQISRARTAVTSARRLVSEMRELDLQTLDLADRMTEILSRQAVNPDAQRTLDQLDREAQETARRMRAAANRVSEIGRTFGLYCLSSADRDCLLGTEAALQNAINRAVAERSSRDQMARQIAAHRTNLIALRCDRTGQYAGDQSGHADISGQWRGFRGYAYSVRQDGSSFSWSVGQLQETATGTINGNSVTASWRNPQWSGSGTGTVERDASGRAVRIRWSNGVVFER